MNLTGLAVIAILGGGFVAWQATKDSARDAQFAKEGKEVPGLIDGGTIAKGRRGSKSYKFDITYTPAGGKEITKNFSVKSAFAQKYLSNETLVNDDVVVRYLPSDPENAIIVDGTSSMGGMETIGYCVAGGGAAVLILGVLRRNKAA